MRYKYTTAVCGCLAHAIAVTVSLLGYSRSSANVPSASLSMPVFICVVLVLAIVWPLWCMVIWHSATKARTLATVVPMLVGLLILSPTYYSFFAAYVVPVPQ